VARTDAVGPGGIFRTLVADHGAHELETVRRFHHAWEAAASLHLREGNPTILDAYQWHGRIVGGSRAEMIDRAFEAWRVAYQEGEPLLLIAGDNATADELARRCRAELIAHRYVSGVGVPIATGTASNGDQIVTLENDRRIKTSRGDYVRNGSRWMVTGVAPDGSLNVVSQDHAGSATLPAEYVREHVALGYAVTVHKTQGQTTERAALLVDERMSAAQLYVGMSRGREENRAFVICSDDDPDEHVRRPSITALDVLTNVMRRDDVNRSAHDVLRRNLAQSEVREGAVPQAERSPKAPLPGSKRSDLALPVKRDPGKNSMSQLDPATRAVLLRSVRRSRLASPPPPSRGRGPVREQ